MQMLTKMLIYSKQDKLTLQQLKDCSMIKSGIQRLKKVMMNERQEFRRSKRKFIESKELEMRSKRKLIH